MRTGASPACASTTPGLLRDDGNPVRRGRDVRETDTLSQPLRGGRERVVRAAVPPGRRSSASVRFRLRAAHHRRRRRRRARPRPRAEERAAGLPAIHAADGPVVPVFHAQGPRVASDPRPWRCCRSAPDRPGRGSRTADRQRSHADDIVDRQTDSRRVRCACWRVRRVALLLAGVGIHGLLAFTVSQRRARDRRAHGARRTTAADRSRHRAAERTARIGRRRAGARVGIRGRARHGLTARGRHAGGYRDVRRCGGHLHPDHAWRDDRCRRRGPCASRPRTSSEPIDAHANDGRDAARSTESGGVGIRPESGVSPRRTTAPGDGSGLQ